MMITLQIAQQTIQVIPQRGIYTMLHLSLSRRFRKNDHNLYHHCLAHSVFLDTMFASAVFRRGNKCAQVYATDFGWARTQWHPEVKHETLSLLFTWDIVPPACIWDNAKEIIQGKFHGSSKMLQLSWNNWSQILSGQILQKKRLKSLRKGLVISYCGQEHKTLMGWLLRVGSLC